MELKRYVLLNNNNLWDLGSKKNAYGYAFNRYTPEHKDMYYDHFEELNGNLILTNGSGKEKVVNTLGNIKKTSDNILDLVEPCYLDDLLGDLYEYNIDDYVMIDKVFSDTDFSEKEVKAIYKRQSNGDYKRYEVGGKE